MNDNSYAARLKFTNEEDSHLLQEFFDTLHAAAYLFFKMGQQSELIRTTLSEISYTKENPSYADLDALYNKLDEQVRLAKQILTSSGIITDMESLDSMDVNEIPVLLEQGAEMLSAELVKESFASLYAILRVFEEGKLEISKLPADFLKYIGEDESQEEIDELMKKLQNMPATLAIEA